MPYLEVTTEADEDAVTLTLKEGDERVSHLEVIPLRQKIGASILTVGGIAGVGTPEKYRMKGYAAQLMNEAVAWMTDAGYDWSGLFGIGDFYYRFGYLSAIPEYRVTIALRDAERAQMRHTVRSFAGTDVPVLLEVYRRTNAARSGLIVRDPDRWAGFKKAAGWGTAPQVDVLVTEDGTLAAYVVYNRYHTNVVVAELGANEPAGYESLLAHLAAVACKRRTETIEMRLPPDHPFAEMASLYGCTVEVRYPHHAEGMWRFLNLRSACGKLCAEWSRRLTASTWSGRARISLRTDLGTVHLEVAGQRVEVADAAENASAQGLHVDVTLPQAVFAQTVLGFVGLNTWLRAQGRPLENQADALIEVLFGARYPLIYWPDRFRRCRLPAGCRRQSCGGTS